MKPAENSSSSRRRHCCRSSLSPALSLYLCSIYSSFATIHHWHTNRLHTAFRTVSISGISIFGLPIRMQAHFSQRFIIIIYALRLIISKQNIETKRKAKRKYCFLSIQGYEIKKNEKIEATHVAHLPTLQPAHAI